MPKFKKHSFVICCALVLLVLLSVTSQALIGSVAAKYATEKTFDLNIRVPKNYYTVTYYQYDDTPLRTIDEWGNVTHTLRDATGVILPENAESFLGWVNALGEAPGAIRETMSLFPSFKYNETIYTVRFMDMKGETLVASATFKESQVGQTASSVITAPETGPDLTGESLEFKGWGVRTDSGATAWTDYTLPNSDVTVYAQYEYSGELNLTPVDTDGDGTVDEYQVDSAAGLSGVLEIPGYINGLPVAVIVDISDDGEINGLWSDGITKVIFNDGTTTIKEGALANTADLKEVVLPSSVTTIESNAFASTMGGAFISKTLTITYDGTWEEFQAIAKENGWESGLVTGTTVVCTNGVATLTARTILGYGYYTWDFEPNS